MKSVRVFGLAAFLSGGIVSGASALPLDVPSPVSPDLVTPVVNGYGPLPYGLYAHRRTRARRSYGTGYHGRGTRTGGPAGGLPNRN